ncbi:MAG: tetraacyldisaccharide 4-kinase [Planctomycetota bacterium]
MSAGRPVPAWAMPIAVPASLAYGAAVRGRNALWSLGLGVGAAGVPVVSVGNIVAGGTGKSPMSRLVAQWMLDAGVRPLLATRGYGAVDGLADEVEEFKALVPGAAVAVDASRRRAIAGARSRGERFDAVLLDDGFQHRALARDLDVVLIDAQRPCLDDWLLPAGWLREPVEGLRRAGAIVVTQSDGVDDALAARIERLAGRAPVAWCRLEPRTLEMHRGSTRTEQPLEWLDGRTVAVWAGLAHPERVVGAVRAAGATVRSAPRLRDHQAYEQGLLRALLDQARGVDAIVVTGKDWPKLAGRVPPFAPPIAVLRAGWRFTAGEAVLHSTILRVVKPNLRGS